MLNKNKLYLCVKDLGLPKPSQEGCVYLLCFAMTTNQDYFLKGKVPDNIFKHLFNLQLHLRPVVATTADALTIQKPLEKAQKPPLYHCCGACSMSSGQGSNARWYYMTQITPKPATVCAYPFS